MEFLLCNEDLGDYDTGDIIDIRVDIFNWGSGERNNPRFKIVRLPNADVGTDLAVLQAKYLAPSIRHCNVCNKFVASSDVEAHLESAHSDILFDVLVNPPRRKSAEEIGVVGAKNRKWVIDGQGFSGADAEIAEKVFASNDSVIAYRVDQHVAFVVVA